MLLLAICLVGHPDSAVVVSRLGHEGCLAPSHMRAIASDPRGWVHIAFAYNIGFPFAESAEVFYTFSTDDGQTWAPLENVSRSDRRTVWPPALTVDCEGNAHCVWNQFWIDSLGGRHYDFFCAGRDSSGWSQPERISDCQAYTNVFDQACVVVDRLGRPHVAFYSDFNPARYDGAIYHCYKDGDTWTRPFCLTPEPRWENQYPSLTVDSQGRLHLAWMLYEWGGNRDTVYYAMYDTVWNPVEVVFARGDVAGVPSIAVDSSDVPWVALLAGPVGAPLGVFVAHRESVGWRYTNICNTPETRYDVSLTIDHDNHLYVVWSEYARGHDLFLRTFDGFAWSDIQNLTNDSSLWSHNPHLAFPTRGRIDLAWFSTDLSGRNREVVYMRLSRVVVGTGEPGGSWTATMPRATLNPTRGPAALSTAGTVYAASGRQVRSGGQNAGSAVHLPPGVYFCRPAGSCETRKLVVVR